MKISLVVAVKPNGDYNVARSGGLLPVGYAQPGVVAYRLTAEIPDPEPLPEIQAVLEDSPGA